MSKGFAMIPRWLLHDDSVTPAAKLTYAILSSHADEHGVCFPSHPTIARTSGLSVSSVQRAIKELTALGLVAQESRRRSSGARSTNRYVLAIAKAVDKSVE